MDIELLGVGGAFSDDTTSYVVNQHILIDCSDGTIKSIIKMKNRKIELIDTVIITHKHMDHIGGLETLIFYKLAQVEFKRNIDLTINVSMDGFNLLKNMACYEFSNFFKVRIINSNTITYEDELIRIKPFMVEHSGVKDAYGFELINKENWKKVAITGDTDKPVVLGGFDYIFHDVGWNGIPIRDNKVHPTEEEILKAYSDNNLSTSNIIGIHTTEPLHTLQKGIIKKLYWI